MNAIKRHLEEQSKKGLAMFKKDMATLCSHIGMPNYDFKVTEEDSEHIDFELNGVPFTVDWNIGKRQSIGRELPIVLFRLSVWNEDGGGRWHPPEWIDKQVVESQCISDIMKAAIIVLVENQINGCLESIAYSEPQPMEEW